MLRIPLTNLSGRRLLFWGILLLTLGTSACSTSRGNGCDCPNKDWYRSR